MVVNPSGYYLIDVTWKGGFKHKVPCRGYQLKSNMAFHDSLFWIESHIHHEVTKEQYEEYLWGSGSLADTEKTNSKTNTRSPRKSGKSQKEVGPKHSATKQSATSATKSTAKKKQSSTRTKKP